MNKFQTTKPEYVDSAGPFAAAQKQRLIDYATELGNNLFESYENMQKIRPIDAAHISCVHSFESMPQNERVNFVYDIFADRSTRTISFIEVFIEIGSWTWLKFTINKKDDSNVNADGKKESVQGELHVHDESSDQRV